ncbi:probable sugar phosphate/phosphate translocator At1g48230 [Hibiscus syriacus]|uniref:probable sugar phosphate/phosphate translocator At1g48230 n=1 Tax=Hibiscus syriacus TaxID=106335 RepID=UPI001921CCD1|nr:probable sugar phosphate/phosphate translocator At1g48230 [Hibiscus syriacus]
MMFFFVFNLIRNELFVYAIHSLHFYVIYFLLQWVLSPKYFNFPFPMTLTMIHMAFSGIVAFFLVRVFKVVAPVKMTFEIYVTCVIPISVFFASSLWFGNTVYLHIYVAFIQMLKDLMPVAIFFMDVMCGTDKPRCNEFLNMVLVSVGVIVSMSWWPYMLDVLGVFTVVTMWAVVVTEGCRKKNLQYYGFKLASAAR